MHAMPKSIMIRASTLPVSRPTIIIEAIVARPRGAMMIDEKITG